MEIDGKIVSIGVLVLLGIFLLSGYFFKAPEPKTPEEISEKLSSAKACSSKNDCISIGSKCPFGCGLAVRKDRANEIQRIVEGYESDCVYKCRAVAGVDCLQGKCVSIFG